MDSKGAALSFFSQTDGLDIRWYSEATTAEKLREALQGNFMMVTASVYLSDAHLVNGSRHPVVGSSQSSFSLDAWLQQVVTRERVGE